MGGGRELTTDKAPPFLMRAEQSCGLDLVASSSGGLTEAAATVACMYADDVWLNLYEIHQETKENTNRGLIKQNMTVSASYLAHVDRFKLYFNII